MTAERDSLNSSLTSARQELADVLQTNITRTTLAQQQQAAQPPVAPSPQANVAPRSYVTLCSCAIWIRLWSAKSFSVWFRVQARTSFESYDGRSHKFAVWW